MVLLDWNQAHLFQPASILLLSFLLEKLITVQLMRIASVCTGNFRDTIKHSSLFNAAQGKQATCNGTRQFPSQLDMIPV